MAVDKSLASGSTSMLLLKLLEDKDMHGYEMIDTLRERSKNVFELKAGTLYPLLHAMEGKGFISSYEEEAVGKVRKYYHLTDAGKKQFKVKSEEWKEYAEAVVDVMGVTERGAEGLTNEIRSRMAADVTGTVGGDALGGECYGQA